MRKISKKLEKRIIIVLSFIFINIYFFGGLFLWIKQNDIWGLLSIIFGEFYLLNLLSLANWRNKKK